MPELLSRVSPYKESDGAICVTGYCSVTEPDYWFCMDLRFYGDRIVLKPCVTALVKDGIKGGVNGYLRATLTAAAPDPVDAIWENDHEHAARFEFAKACAASSEPWLRACVAEFIEKAKPVFETALQEELADLERRSDELRVLLAGVPEWPAQR